MAPCWLASGWSQSMVDTGKRVEVKGRRFPFSRLLQCRVSNGGCTYLQLQLLPDVDYSSHWDSVTISYSFPALPFSPMVDHGSLFLVPRCLTILSGFPYPSLYIYNLSLFERYFLLGIEFWVDSFVFVFIFQHFSSLHGF